jgi:hypothetical protein
LRRAGSLEIEIAISEGGKEREGAKKAKLSNSLMFRNEADKDFCPEKESILIANAIQRILNVLMLKIMKD